MKNRGPAPRRDVKVDFVAKAREAWGESLPAWVEELARVVTVTSQGNAGRRIGYSSGVISTVIYKKYKGDLARVEAKVRGALMNEKVNCPGLGEIGRNTCLDWQAKPFAASSSLRVRMFHECRGGCPHSRLKID